MYCGFTNTWVNLLLLNYFLISLLFSYVSIKLKIQGFQFNENCISCIYLPHTFSAAKEHSGCGKQKHIYIFGKGAID